MYTVLYIENSPQVFAQTAKMISRLGYFLYVAENGHEGLRICQEVKPDIIITDISMSAMNGIELSRQARLIDENVQIILTVGNGESDLILNSFDLQINCFLSKPLNMDQLTNALSLCSQQLDRIKSINFHKQSHQLLAEALNRSPNLVTITDKNGIIQYVNSRACTVTAKDKSELVNQHITWLYDASSETKNLLQNVFIKGKEWTGELILKTETRDEIIEETIISPVLGSSGKTEYFIFYSEDVTMRKAAEAEVLKLNAELEYRVLRRTALLDATNKELDEFCDAISHELCGPLSRLQGLSKALYEDFIEIMDENGKDYLKRINQTSVQLKTIIDALVGLTQLTRRNISMQEVNLSSICGDLAQKLSIAEPDKNVKFFISPDIKVNGDNALLKIVMESLLNNAWANIDGYSNPRIEFGVARSSGKAVYFVRDNGCGFDPNYSNKLFKLFNHSNKSYEKCLTSGTELVAAQRIIQRHGGRIWAESELGKGATFYFTI